MSPVDKRSIFFASIPQKGRLALAEVPRGQLGIVDVYVYLYSYMRYVQLCVRFVSGSKGTY